MTTDNERSFKSSNKCWIDCTGNCGRLDAELDNEVRDHDRVTGKYMVSAHKDCNINLRLAKTFHN